jgi:hypothetical protein
MKYDHFLLLMLSHKKASEDLAQLFDMGFDLMGHKYDLSKPLNDILKATIESHYGEQGWEWVSWFTYESDYGQRDWSSESRPKSHGAEDEDGNPICHSFESLWEYLEKQHKLVY